MVYEHQECGKFLLPATVVLVLLSILTLVTLKFTGVFESATLHGASEKGDKDRVELLLRKGVDVNTKTKKGQTALYFAAGNGHKDIAQLLILKGADVNAPDKAGLSPLHVSVFTGNAEVARLLISNGAELNAVTLDGATPMHIAVISGETESVELLIEKGGDVNAIDSMERTPMDWALVTDKPKLFKILRKHGGRTGRELEGECRQEVRVAVSRVMIKFARAEFEIEGVPPLNRGPSFKDKKGQIHRKMKLKKQVEKKLVPLGKHAVPELIEWLDHDENYVRFTAMYALENITGINNTAIFGKPYSEGWFKDVKQKWKAWYEKNKDK